MHEKTVLAIDPGTSKCGMAMVARDAQGAISLLWRQVRATEELAAGLDEAKEVAPYSLVIVGAGTHSRETVHVIREHNPSTAILIVDEKNTTLEAREKYWEYHPRKGWRRLLPATMQVPPDPVDDFVALILAERVLHEG